MFRTIGQLSAPVWLTSKGERVEATETSVQWVRRSLIASNVTLRIITIEPSNGRGVLVTTRAIVVDPPPHILTMLALGLREASETHAEQVEERGRGRHQLRSLDLG